MARPRKTIFLCECGNPQKQGQEGCDECRAIDAGGRYRATERLRPTGNEDFGPTSLHMADFQRSHRAAWRVPTWSADDASEGNLDVIGLYEDTHAGDYSQ